MSKSTHWKCDNCGNLEDTTSIIELPSGWNTLLVRADCKGRSKDFCGNKCAIEWLGKQGKGKWDCE